MNLGGNMNLKSEKGFTLVEMIVVIAIMGILGTMVMKIFVSSNTFYYKVQNDYYARNNARTVVSYINNMIRRNDSSNRVKVEENKLTIYNEDGTRKSTIYFQDGKLINEWNSKKICVAEITSFSITNTDDGGINIIVGYTDGSKIEKRYDETIYLRSTYN